MDVHRYCILPCTQRLQWQLPDSAGTRGSSGNCQGSTIAFVEEKAAAVPEPAVAMATETLPSAPQCFRSTKRKSNPRENQIHSKAETAAFAVLSVRIICLAAKCSKVLGSLDWRAFLHKLPNLRIDAKTLHTSSYPEAPMATARQCRNQGSQWQLPG